MYVDCNKVELFPSVQEEDCGWELSKKAADFLGAGQVHYYQTLSSQALNSIRFALKVVGNICFMNESWWWDNCWWCGAAHSWQVDCNWSLQPHCWRYSNPFQNWMLHLLSLSFGNAVFKSLEFPCTVPHISTALSFPVVSLNLKTESRMRKLRFA